MATQHFKPSWFRRTWGSSASPVTAPGFLVLAALAALAAASLGCDAVARFAASLDSAPAPSPSGPARAASPHLEMGVPTDADPSDEHVMIKPQYALSYALARGGPNWVSWNLNRSHFGATARHRGKFFQDESLPEGALRVRHEDYTSSGYDRGHLVRSEERTSSREDNQATFLMTNILPQRHALNAGPWLRFEEHCAELARAGGRELYIVAGGVHGARPVIIGGGVAVPEAFFKIVVSLGPGRGAADVNERTPVLAVVMPNAEGIRDHDWERYRVPVSVVERRTGYDFLTALPDELQRILEGRVAELH